MDAAAHMGWLDRITNLHFGGSFLLVTGTGTVRDDHAATPLSPPSVSFTPVGAPQDFVSFKQLDKTSDPQSIVIPDQFIPETIYTIWNPAVPLPDDTNAKLVLPSGIPFAGQFMFTHQNIVQDLLLFENPPIFVNGDGTFNSLADAQAAKKYMAKTTFDSWLNAQGIAVDAGYINNFAVAIPVNIKINGQGAASNIVKVLYSIPAQGALQVSVSSQGPNPTSSAAAQLFLNASLKKIADAAGKTADAGSSKNLAGSHNYVVRFSAGKNPVVTIS